MKSRTSDLANTIDLRIHHPAKLDDHGFPLFLISLRCVSPCGFHVIDVFCGWNHFLRRASLILDALFTRASTAIFQCTERQYRSYFFCSCAMGLFDGGLEWSV